MSSTKDVDEAILDQAKSLLSYVRSHGIRDLNVRCLSELPWFLVVVFELLTTETIPQEMKPFSCLEEQAHTLQMILDTLEQTLRLPMNHITGRGLARLERRHLSDALQIFSDLVKHCYPKRGASETSNIGGTPEGQGQSRNQFESPEFGAINFSQSNTPELLFLPTGREKVQQGKRLECNVRTQKQLEKTSRSSPVVAVRPVPQISLSPLSTTVKKGPFSQYAKGEEGFRNGSKRLTNFVCIRPIEKDDSFKLSKSSTTLVKEVYRQKTSANEESRHRHYRTRGQARETRNNESPQTPAAFERRLPSLSFLSPIYSSDSKQDMKRLPNVSQAVGQSRNVSSLETKSHRYTPYEQPSKPYDIIEYPLTKRAGDFRSQRRLSTAVETKDVTKLNQNTFKRPPSAKFILCRKPSVKSFQSPKQPVSKRTSTLQKENTGRKNSTKKVPTNNNTLAKERSVSLRTKSDIKTSEESAKESQALLYKSRKPSVTKSKPNPPITRTVRKPPQPLARKPSSKSVAFSSGQNHCSRIETDRRRTSVSSRRHAEADVKGKQIFCETGSHSHVSANCIETKCHCPLAAYEHSTCNRRRPSVVSTKVRKHSSTSARSPVHTFERNSRLIRPVKRGDVSPQTSSLCSSLKLLEEFDFVKRRLKEIKDKKREFMEAISELEQEEVRLEYLLSHVQQQSTRALKKGSADGVASLGAAV